MKQALCQSCGMPMEQARWGTLADGTSSDAYCSYCMVQGHFCKEMTMEEMISLCVPFVREAHPELSEAQAKEQMRQFYPTLDRWRSTDQ